jgi:hypothetical protein
LTFEISEGALSLVRRRRDASAGEVRMRVEADELLGLRAAANGALPQEQRITQDVVQMLREAITEAHVSGNLIPARQSAGARDQHQYNVDRWRDALARVAALLPSEEPT